MVPLASCVAVESDDTLQHICTLSQYVNAATRRTKEGKRNSVGTCRRVSNKV